MGQHELVERLGRIEGLDVAAKTAGKAVARVVAPRPLKDVLSGSWLGHPFHPLLTDIPIGAWTSALVLDFIGGRRRQEAADRLIGLGVLAALPTAATGASADPSLRAAMGQAGVEGAPEITFWEVAEELDYSSIGV